VIQGQGRGQGASEVPKIALLQLYLLRHLLKMAASMSRDLQVEGVPAVNPSTKSFFFKFGMYTEVDE